MKNNDDFFGTMFDFDGDGHTDITETYMAYRMMNDDYALTAVNDSKLWEAIRHHRETYTSIHDMDYTPDIRKRLILVPREDIIDNWRRDYEEMSQTMIYGDKPTFNELLEAMRELEHRFKS